MTTGLTSRMKGQRGEREVAAILREHGYEARRGTQSRGGDEEADVVSTLPGFRLEVKRTERLNVRAALVQCERDLDPADDDTVACVVHRSNRVPWLVTLRFEDLLALVERGRE